MHFTEEQRAPIAHGALMDGGRSPIRDGDWCVLRWVRGAAVEALRDRVVLVQKKARDEGAQYQLKRLVEREGAWCFVSDGEGPSFAATAGTVVIARVERVVTPESLAPAVGAELDEAAIAAHFGWDAFERVVRRDGHRFAWIEGAGAMRAPDRIAGGGAPPWPGETSYVFTRATAAGPWRYGGVARWLADEGQWAFEGVDRATWQAIGGGRGASRTLLRAVDARIDAWIDRLVASPGFGNGVEVDGRAFRIVRKSEEGGLRIDGGPGGFKERTVSRADLGWTLLAADDVARHGGVLDEARVNRMRYLDGTPKDATRWIDTGWAIRLWRLANEAE